MQEATATEKAVNNDLDNIIETYHAKKANMVVAITRLDKDGKPEIKKDKFGSPKTLSSGEPEYITYSLQFSPLSTPPGSSYHSIYILTKRVDRWEEKKAALDRLSEQSDSTGIFTERQWLSNINPAVIAERDRANELEKQLTLQKGNAERILQEKGDLERKNAELEERLRRMTGKNK